MCKFGLKKVKMLQYIINNRQAHVQAILRTCIHKKMIKYLYD